MPKRKHHDPIAYSLAHSYFVSGNVIGMDKANQPQAAAAEKKHKYMKKYFIYS